MIIISVTIAFAQIITMWCDINSGKRQHAKNDNSTVYDNEETVYRAYG